jgi:2'-hydroxyisoflavone reductase
MSRHFESPLKKLRVLILGGTQFVGRHIAEACLAGGHSVTVLNRGITPDELPVEVERLRGDRDAGIVGLAALGDRTWDACVDASGYFPHQVRSSSELLQDRVGHYLYISAVRVYGDPLERPVRETHPLLPPAPEDVTEIDDDSYGRLKVACENVVQEMFGNRTIILRPQVVVGPYDPSGRFTFWLKRAVRGGPMLAPGDGADHLQVIDARDLALFVVNIVERGLTGVFNLAGKRATWEEFIRLIGAEYPHWVGAELLRRIGVSYFELPLYRPENGRLASLMDISNEKAVSAGLTLTDLEATIRDTWAWSAGGDEPPPLSPEREAELIRASADSA